jgi:tetratricopeptide (TPR) repeat protein
MSKKNLTQEELAVNEAVSKTEQFFEKYVKWCLVALVVLLLLIGGGYAYKALVWDKDVAAAKELIVKAQERFPGATPNYDLALNGDENGAGFKQVADEYSWTPAGNIAKHYAGICYLHLNDLENAAKYLASYSTVSGLANEIINAQNLGLQGDIAVEQGDYAKAAKLYAKAVKESENGYTAPLYLYKGGMAYKAAGELEDAKECFETIIAKYPMSMENRDAEMALGSL